MAAPVKFRVAPGGNRGGKTTTGDLSVIIDCTPSDLVPPHLLPYKRWEPPIQVYLIAVSGRAVERIHLPIFRQWCPSEILVGNSFKTAFNKEYQTLHFKDGTTVSFMTQGMDREVFQGVALHIVHFDEEPLHEHGHEIFAECMQRLVDFNGDLRMTFTPLDGMTWVYDKLWLPWAQQQPEKEDAVSGFSEITFGGVKLATYVHRFHQDDNPVIDPEGKAASLAMAKSDADRVARQTGLFVAMTGRVFSEFQRHKHVVPDEDVLERLRHRHLQMLIGGLDPGFRHMAAAVWVGLDHDGVWIGPEVICQKTIIPHVATELQLAAKQWELPLPLFVADPAIRKTDGQTGVTDQVAYMNAGIQTRIGINDVRPGINAINALCYNGRLHVMASCEVLIEQLLRSRWKRDGRSEDASPERPVKKDDHATDALRYAIMALPVPEAAPEEDSLTEHQRAVKAHIARAVNRHEEGPSLYGQGYWDS